MLSTLARIYVTPGPHQGTLRRTLETSQGVAEAGQGHRRGVAWLISLWSGCVKYAVKIDSGLIQPAPLSDVEETVSGGVFSQDMEVLLKSSAPLLLRAAAALVHDAGPEIISDSEVVEATLQLSPLALLLLQRECDSSSNGLKDGGGTAAVAGRAASSCALASSLCSLLCARAVSLVMVVLLNQTLPTQYRVPYTLRPVPYLLLIVDPIPYRAQTLIHTDFDEVL